MSRAARFVALFLAAICLGGCDQLFQKSSKDDFASGDRKAAAGDFRGAVSEYEAALDGTPKTAEAHYKLALLYDGKLQSPRDAIHHLGRYLEIVPQGAHAKDARAIIKQSEERLVLSQGKGNFVTQGEAVRLKSENLRLQQTITKMRSEKAAATPFPADKRNEVAQKPIPPGTRTHVVQPGETMAIIAKKYYKNSNRWSDIQDANFYSTNGTQRIKAGQTLIIP